MDSLDDDFSYYLQLYKDNYIAYGLDDNDANKKLLTRAKIGLQEVNDRMNINKSELESKNSGYRKEIRSLNKLIKRSENKNVELNDIVQRLSNSDAGAIEQDRNKKEIYDKRKLQTILEVVLIALILILGYINGDILQAIRSRFSTKA